jgi:predicted RNA-binding Zn-ribbon protein involved in translation (DUF1610 family)
MLIIIVIKMPYKDMDKQVEANKRYRKRLTSYPKCPMCGEKQFEDVGSAMGFKTKTSSFAGLSLASGFSSTYIVRDYDLFECVSCGFAFYIRQKEAKLNE